MDIALDLSIHFDMMCQFHALPEDLDDLASMFIFDLTIYMIVAESDYDSRENSHKNFRLSKCVDGRLMQRRIQYTHDWCIIKFIAFTVEDPVMNNASRYDFSISDPGAAVLKPGRLTDGGLEDSCLFSRPTVDAVKVLWSGKMAKFKKGLSTGAIAFNPLTGASGPAKWHRFSKGARRAYAEGINIRVAGTPILYKFPVI